MLGGARRAHARTSSARPARTWPRSSPTPESPALLDVFGLGALSYLILTGQPPAATRGELATRLTAGPRPAPVLGRRLGQPRDGRPGPRRHPALPGRPHRVRPPVPPRASTRSRRSSPRRNADPEQDPLTAGRGDEIDGLDGDQRSSARARPPGAPGLDRRRRLRQAASSRSRSTTPPPAAWNGRPQQLGPLNDSHVARLLDPPFEAGPHDARRTVIGVEYVGDHTLAEELRQHGPLTIHELERLGEDLFQAVTFLDKRGIWHRDIKPDNLALRSSTARAASWSSSTSPWPAPRTPTSASAPGTTWTRSSAPPSQAALRPGRRAVRGRGHPARDGQRRAAVLGRRPARRPASSTPPRRCSSPRTSSTRWPATAWWSSSRSRCTATPPGGSATLHEMTRAWTDIFRDLETVPPLTTAVHQRRRTTADGRRASRPRPSTPAPSAPRQRAKATAATPLAAAGLSPYALSIAQQRLGVDTAGDLARVPARRITGCAASAAVPRYELVRLSREWRQRFNLTEAGLPARTSSGPKGRSPHPFGITDLIRTDRACSPASARLPETAGRPGAAVRRRGRAPPGPGLAGAGAGDRPGARRGRGRAGLAVGRPAGDRPRHRPARSGGGRAPGPAAQPLAEVRPGADPGPRRPGRDPRRARPRSSAGGSSPPACWPGAGPRLGDPAERLRLAAICVRAAVETEERRDSARMRHRRLTGVARRRRVRRPDAGARRADRHGEEKAPPRAPMTCSPTPSCSARRPTSCPPGIRCPASPRSGRRCARCDTAEHATAAVRHRPGAARRRRVREDRGDARGSSCTRGTCPPSAR